VSDCVVPAVCVAVPVITRRVAAPALTVTFADVPGAPLPAVAVRDRGPLGSVSVRVVSVATPAVKSPALVSLLAPLRPVIVPVLKIGRASCRERVSVAVEAVIALTKASCAVSVLTPVNAAPLVCGLVHATTHWIVAG